MQSFLDKLSEHIVTNYKDLSGLCVVFPSRRAGLYFKDSLKKQIKKSQRIPDVYSIEDFLLKLSNCKPASKLVILFNLYDILKPRLGEESFDHFYSWGEMLLNDFNDIDNNLVDAKYIFKIIREFREIDEEFKLSLADEEAFRKFWEIFSAREPDEYSGSFLNMWSVMGDAYTKLKSSLEENGLAYEGMANRKAYQLVRTGKADITWQMVIFAGLNSLNKAENGIIKELLKRGKAEVFWDADEYYINDTKQEAGYFLRKNFAELSIQQPRWIEKNLSQKPKQIISIGAPLIAGQAKTLGYILDEQVKNENLVPDKTVVVLPDERLLIPALYSIPEGVEHLNVTMGFPFRHSALFSFIELLRVLQKNKRTGEHTAYYHRDVINLLLHSFAVMCAEKDVNELIKKIRQGNLIYVPGEMLIDESEFLKLVFRDVQNTEDSVTYITEVLERITEKLEQGAEPGAKFELEFFRRFNDELNTIRDVLMKYQPSSEAGTFWKLLHEVTAGMKTPFSGEPLKGLQVMGLLETRALDFENVFILSMNEGIMPKGSSVASFIPYNLRKAFNLPTYEDSDTITSYYFYRLLQRAKNIFLIYNSEVNVLSAGEKSRYILQIENELKVHKPVNKTAQMPVAKKPDTKIQIQKPKDLISKLQERDFISPSLLNTYINCTLQFYLKYIAGLEEAEDVEEFFEPGTFGSIIHNMLDKLYKPFKGREVTTEDIEKIIKDLKKNYNSLLNEVMEDSGELKRFSKNLKGKNLLLKGVIEKLIVKVLENDKSHAPIKLLEVEREFIKELSLSPGNKKQTIKIGGRIDRIEEKDNTLRILDYKTGRVKKNVKSISESVLENLFTDPGYKEYFQIMMYMYLYKDEAKACLPELNTSTEVYTQVEHRQGKNIEAGIYPLKALGSGEINFIDAPAGMLNEFESKLIKLLEELFNPAISFTQTDDEDRCKFCPYQRICYREGEI